MPQHKDNHPLEGTLVYQDHLPVAWEVRSEADQHGELARASDRNEHLLRYANLLGEQPRERPDEDAEGENRLNRIESKVDLMIDLLSRLLEQEGEAPRAEPVRLSGAGIEWRSDTTPPAVEEAIWILLQLDGHLPGVLRFPAQVLEVEQNGEGYRTTAVFRFLGENVQDLLEKIIFRHHRRQVAQSRPQAT